MKLTPKSTKDIQRINSEKFFAAFMQMEASRYITGTWTYMPDGSFKLEGNFNSRLHMYDEDGRVIGAQWFEENGQRAFESYTDSPLWMEASDTK